jgi:hypothetical protein
MAITRSSIPTLIKRKPSGKEKKRKKKRKKRTRKS